MDCEKNKPMGRSMTNHNPIHSWEWHICCDCPSSVMIVKEEPRLGEGTFAKMYVLNCGYLFWL